MTVRAVSATLATLHLLTISLATREHVPIRRTSAATNQVATSSALRQEEGVTIHVDRAAPDGSDFGICKRRAVQ